MNAAAQAADAGRVHLGCAQAHELALAALRGIGYDAGEAGLIAAHVLDAALCGYEYSGLAKILNVAQLLPRHPVDGPMRLRHETAVSALYDGANRNGMITVDRATDLAIAKAREHGFGVVGVHRTWMSGRSAYFVERIARAGLVGIHTVGSVPQVAPPGGAAAAIGTNPIAFGFPTEDAPLVIDMGFAALMFTDLRLRARRGERLPEGVAIDSAGRPTQDPVAALAGAVQCFGGYKGFGLALAMQAMAVLAGAGDDPDGAGYLVLALRPDLLVPLDAYRRGVSALLARIKATPRQPGVDEIRIPSERSARSRERLQREGIAIDALVHEGLQRLARAGA
jgi:LDH2 family malate/lactate/ureidoglycolate dehydrogenase